METRSVTKRPASSMQASSPMKIVKKDGKQKNLPKMFMRNAFTTPPRSKPQNDTTDKTPDTPSKRTKRILDYIKVCKTENKNENKIENPDLTKNLSSGSTSTDLTSKLSSERSTDPTLTEPSSEPSSSSTSFKNKLSSSKARRCLFPSSQSTFKQSQETLARSFTQKTKHRVALKTKQWHYDFENDQPLENSVNSSPVWKLEINPPKFYATRSRVQEKLELESTVSTTGSVIQEAIKEVMLNKTPVKTGSELEVNKSSSDTNKDVSGKFSSPDKSKIGLKTTNKSRTVVKTPQKQQKITDTYSPRKSVSPGAKKGSGFVGKKGLNKARRKLSHL